MTKGYICVNDVFNENKDLGWLTPSANPIESQGLSAPVANLGARGEESVNASVGALLAFAFAHSDKAARKARLIATALDQWSRKTEANQAHERPLLLKDMDDLSAMLGGRS